jgi:4-alpha-glucanotransferase
VAELDSTRFAAGRHAGVMVPLFSIPSRSSWGIGEIPDLARLARWVSSAGMDFVQLLPVNEMEEGQNSPYSALSAMAIDPIFVALSDLEDYTAAERDSPLRDEERARLEAARRSPSVDHAVVRELKLRALHDAFAAFESRGGHDENSHAKEFRGFMEREAWWLDEYALFRALHEEHQARYWLDWEAPLRNRDPGGLAAASQRLARQIRYFKYVQWVADEQWQRVRREAAPVGIFGDFPFMVSGHSADVWARQDEFRLDASVGVPPDAFSDTGQDWGLPVYRWDVIAARGYDWLRNRTRRCAELYDGFRVDHLVGFYRTFVHERDGTTGFVPPDEPAQLAQGETLLRLLASWGSRIIAEDLGTVPDFVRTSMARLGIPGLQVLRWERHWNKEPARFRDPADYPATGAATTGTHDTETMAEWWDGADEDERRLILELPGMRDAGVRVRDPFSARTRDALLSVLFGSGSDFVILPMQDIFGWRDRINTPASTGEQNWTWRLPWPVEDLTSRDESVARARFLRALSARHSHVRA